MAVVYVLFIFQLGLIYPAYCSPVYNEIKESQTLEIRGDSSGMTVWSVDRRGNWSTEPNDEKNAQDKLTVGQERKDIADHDVSGMRLYLAFSAYLSHNLNGLRVGQIVVFDRVLLNDGGMYDRTRGIFTVPISGVYSFSYYLGSRGNNQVFVVLTLDGQTISEAAAQTNSKKDDGQGGNTSIIHARKDQKVSVRYIEGDGHIEGYETYRITTFSGQLLYVR